MSVDTLVDRTPVVRRLGFFVAGIPQAQGSKDAHHANGRSWVSENNPKLRPWRNAVVEAAALTHDHHPVITGAVALTVTFSFPRPKGHFGKRGLLPSAPERPIGARNDLDKLVRAIGDALTEAGIWRDDGQVVEIRASKVYGDRPGAAVVVEELRTRIQVSA